MIPLHGFSIRVDPILAGCKRAVKQGNTFIVSPAMYALMDGATSEELERLLGTIEFIDLGEPLGMYTSLPMTTMPPPPF
jgi:hypothetical protein